VEKLLACARKLGVVLDPLQSGQFSTYYSELVDWNNRFNLTGITDYEGVQLKHFCDSLTLIPVIERKPGIKILDVGAGAGFPGIPLKIAMPDISLTLLEATAKKSVFLEHLKRKLGLTNVSVITVRAEDAAHQPEYREQFEIVLARAVAPMPALVELCLPFCKIGGRFIAQKKGDTSGENQRAAKAIKLMGGFLRAVKKVDLEELADERRLVVFDKVSATPREYPRRPGTPAKKPIL
jgi:16S rRNA (guanine527-N7)-methyltransferase